MSDSKNNKPNAGGLSINLKSLAPTATGNSPSPMKDMSGSPSKNNMMRKQSTMLSPDLGRSPTLKTREENKMEFVE